MAQQFNYVRLPDVYNFSQFSGTAKDLEDDLNSYVFGNGVQVFDSTRNPGTAMVVHPDSGSYVTVIPGQWVGYNYGSWEVHNDEEMHGTTNGGYTPAA